MPFNTVQSVNNAVYYKIKNIVKYITIKNNKEITKETPAIILYDPNTQTDIFISTSTGGHLASLKIGDKKTGISKAGQPYEIQELFLEFHSINQKGGLLREILSTNWSKPLCYALLGKLATCKDFSNINIEFDKYINKDTGNSSNIVKVFEGVPFIEDSNGRISMFISDEKWRKSKDQIVLPKKTWLKKDGKTFTLTENYNEASKDQQGNATIDPDYDIELLEIYTNIVKFINDQLKPLQDYVQLEVPVVKITNDQIEDDEIYPESKIFSSDLPEIDINTINVQMPF